MYLPFQTLEKDLYESSAIKIIVEIWHSSCIWCNIQQYFSFIMAVIYIVGGNRKIRRKRRPVASHW